MRLLDEKQNQNEFPHTYLACLVLYFFLRTFVQDKDTLRLIMENMKLENIAVSDSISSPKGNVTDNGLFKWVPGEETEPLSDEDMSDVFSRIPGNSPLKDMPVRPGRGLGRDNLNALINKGTPFLLTGVDDDLRGNLAELAKLKIDNEHQPYVIVNPIKVKGTINFHIIEAMAPHLNPDLNPVQEKKDFLMKFLHNAEEAIERVKAEMLEHEDLGISGRSSDVARAKPTRSVIYDRGPFVWKFCIDSTTCNTLKSIYGSSYNCCPTERARYWDTVYLDYYKTSSSHDIVVRNRGNWDTNYKFNDGNDKRGYANGYSYVEATGPSGYALRDFWPKNTNNVNSISRTEGFQLSGSAECGESCSGGLTATYSKSTSVSTDIKDWEIKASGYGKWEYKQAHPFKPSVPYDGWSAMNDGDTWNGGSIHGLPALSTGVLDMDTQMIYSGSNTGWQCVHLKEYGYTFLYTDKGWWSWRADWWGQSYTGSKCIYVG